MKKLSLSLLLFAASSLPSYAGTYEQCVVEAVSNPDNIESTTQIRERCQKQGGSTTVVTANEQQKPAQMTERFERGAISERIIAEREIQKSRYAILPHKQNYFLPVTHTSKINREAYDFAGEAFADDLRQTEAKIQVSLKVPLNSEDIFMPGDGIYFGFTATSWWQVYASNISAPFRETNYQPEVWYMGGLDWHPLGGNTGFKVGIEHQSNGRSQLLSRSWNRVYTTFMFEKDDFALAFRPWYRLREDDKDDPLDSDGDDNPDIERYMGHFDLTAAYRLNDHEFSMILRNNLRSENKGAVELGWSVPIYGNIKGYMQYFNGYGESLIDYNISQERIGLGILISDIL